MSHDAKAFYEFDAFRLDARRRLLYHDGRPVALPPKALDTLLALVERAGEDVTKADLMDAIWPDAHVEENNLTQAVSTLRRALGERRDDHRFVVTLPGRGYRFVAPVRTVETEAHAEPATDRATAPRRRLAAAVAAAVLLAALGATAWLWPEEPPAVTAEPARASVDPAAFEAYARGRFFWNKRTRENYERAAALFREAIERDPRYAAAYAGLADTYVLVALGEVDPSARAVAFERAKEAALAAVALDPSLAEAHASLAAVSEVFDKDRSTAEREYRTAIALDPGYATAHQWYGEFLEAEGRYDEATRVLRRAKELDPLSLAVNVALGENLYYLRRYDEAVAQFKRTLELDPGFMRARFDLALALEQRSRYDEAIAEFERIRNSDAGNMRAIAALAHVYASAGRRDEMRRLHAEFERRARDGVVEPYDRLILYVSAGDYDRAVEWLARARERHDGDLLRLTADPRLDALLADARVAWPEPLPDGDLPHPRQR
jgi:DNA-binding winged helix-turn-helix (wHTH) protein/Tfp pilus assembly protein PilF